MLAPPQIFEVDVDPEVLERMKLTGKFEDECGITGFAVISTSHMSIHCWPLQKFFSLDAFSCKNFDVGIAITLIQDLLDVISHETKILPRFKP